MHFTYLLIHILFLSVFYDTRTMAVVSIDQGSLKGSKCYTDKGTEYHEFLCIPYAKPPVGNLRFKSPQPPEPWKGLRDATTANPNYISCQMDLVKGQYIGTEDCLYLNVYTPKLPNNGDNSELLPVMFSIHGGGFLHGNGIIKDEGGPDYLIDKKVVVVTINYRLGIFGFLSLNMPEAAGNMGLKDQVQALIWVQDNIKHFGGDKNKVTIFGVSAGSASIEYHILSTKSRGLFHKAILHSGSSLNHWAINFKPQELLHKVLQQLGYESSAENHEDVYEFLMTLPPELLTEKSNEVINESAPERLFFGFVPTVELDYGIGEAFLTTNPYKLLKEGSFNKVPVIKGFCELESCMMTLSKPAAVEELEESGNYVRHLPYALEAGDLSQFNERFAAAYNKSRNNATAEQFDRRVTDFFSDFDFISGIWLSGNIMSDYGIDVYLYQFSYDGKINFLKNLFDIRKKGACHADDVTYIFKTQISNMADDTDICVRDKLTTLWTNFAKTSNPVRPVAVEDFSVWPALNTTSPVYLDIDKKFQVKPYTNTNKMDIFKDIYDKYQICEN